MERLVYSCMNVYKVLQKWIEKIDRFHDLLNTFQILSEEHRKSVQRQRKKEKLERKAEEKNRTLTDEEIWKRLDDLERQEAEGQELQRLMKAFYSPLQWSKLWKVCIQMLTKFITSWKKHCVSVQYKWPHMNIYPKIIKTLPVYDMGLKRSPKVNMKYNIVTFTFQSLLYENANLVAFSFIYFFITVILIY